MFALIVAIISSGLIFVLFKLFPRFKIDTFQAIVFNYFTAFLSGVLLFGKDWDSHALNTGNWLFFSIVVGFLLISLFYLMGTSTQKNGVAITSVAVKMSMAISLIFMIILYKETVNVIKLSGILLAFVGVFLVSYSKSNGTRNKHTWMLFVLFVGSGLLDVVLNYVQKYELTFLTPSLFSAISFGFAGLLGLGFMSYQFISKKNVLHPRSILAGIALGIPNYFSIYLLLEAYSSTGWNDSTVLAILNVSIVLLSAIVGLVIFREKLTKNRFVGLLAAVMAIFLLLIANT